MRYIIALIFTTLLFAQDTVLPIPKNVSYDKAKAALGKVLFFDPTLSADGTVSCASCHSFAHGGADDKPVSIGVYAKKGRMNSPTVFNARYNFRQFWNGRAKNLFDQIDGPVHNPVEMGLSTQELIEKLYRNDYYKQTFIKVFGPGPITYEHYKEALVEFEKSLVTPNSKFDRFLRGEAKLSPQEMRGWRLFKLRGCITCHNGINLGGNSFQKIGSIMPFEGAPLDDRYALTKNPKDRYVFKVPTLRNIALTAPYFHDGSVATLKEAIKKMAYYNLGTILSDQEIAALEAFLHTLTGELPDAR